MIVVIVSIVAPAVAMKWFIDHNLDEVQALVPGGRLSLDFGPAKYALQKELGLQRISP
jgi:hypothetical protein